MREMSGEGYSILRIYPLRKDSGAGTAFKGGTASGAVIPLN